MLHLLRFFSAIASHNGTRAGICTLNGPTAPYVGDTMNYFFFLFAGEVGEQMRAYFRYILPSAFSMAYLYKRYTLASKIGRDLDLLHLSNKLHIPCCVLHQLFHLHRGYDTPHPPPGNNLKKIKSIK